MYIVSSHLTRAFLHLEGIKRAITLGMKNDTNGLGAKSDEWSFQWWDHVFNKTSASLSITKDVSNPDGGITVVAKENKAVSRQLLYGSFVKAKTMDGTIEEEVYDPDKDYSIKVTDEELLKACEGRTARKGARAHQPGKLLRTGMAIMAGNGEEERGSGDRDVQSGKKRKAVEEEEIPAEDSSLSDKKRQKKMAKEAKREAKEAKRAKRAAKAAKREAKEAKRATKEAKRAAKEAKRAAKSDGSSLKGR
ncbi:hypothetical protein DFS34DRAFT_581750 [Phlyctochytrium arcticum]|nr:hypothetical protein DFS34DRAFT_581750 [Phlyctochytrium arcticum]